MTFSVGTDIVEIGRIKKIIEKNEKFKLKIFTKNEIEFCENKKNKKYESYAARFAAKEAIYKALSEKIDFEYKWTDFEILNKSDGKPMVMLNHKIEGLEGIEISLSHSNEYAVAYVMAIFKWILNVCIKNQIKKEDIEFKF